MAQSLFEKKNYEFGNIVAVLKDCLGNFFGTGGTVVKKGA